MYNSRMKYTNGDADNHPFGWQSEDFRDGDAGQAADDDISTASSSDADPRDADELMGEWGEQEPSDEDILGIDADADDVEEWDDGLGYAEIDSEYDEPVPSAEYNYELHEPLHVADVAHVDIGNKVRIDEFISGIDDISDAQSDQIAELLGNLGRSRLLSWLSEYDDWTGHSLILFLEFRTIWENNHEWWESRFGWRRYGSWWHPRNRYNKSNLTRDWMRELILHRLHCSAEEVIDEEWFDDWEISEMWRRGFPTFAAFALFRAEIGEDADWQASLDSWEGDNQTNDESIPYQDWYGVNKWRDNLGW